MKTLEMWTEKCKCGVILHQMNAPCFECRKSDLERSKREDSIEKVVPPKLTRGMAISVGKRLANLKKIAEVSTDWDAVL